MLIKEFFTRRTRRSTRRYNQRVVDGDTGSLILDTFNADAEGQPRVCVALNLVNPVWLAAVAVVVGEVNTPNKFIV